jgi:serine/threonine protein phosphatase PrpC
MAAAAAPLPRLFSGKDLAGTELHPLGDGLAAVATRKSPDKSSDNEDSCAIIPFDESSGVIVVADGCGGLPQGGKASQLAVQALRAAIKQAQKKNLTLREGIMDGFERANHDVIALGVGAGTTLAVAEIRGHEMRPYHVGDSQILVIGPMGKVKYESKPHSPVGYGVEAGLINPSEALHHAERHLVSNLIGDAGMSIEVGSAVQLAPRDTLVIASDGLFDNLRLPEIAAACRKTQLLATCDELVENSVKRMEQPTDDEPSKPDDLTIVTYRRRASAGKITNSV